jgi:thiol-disulfide isomerase/thioredoxin
MNTVFLFSLFLIGLASFKNDEKIGWELEPGIYILDKKTPVKSLDDLITLLKDKQIYIDRWATWCGPCLEQFAYKDTLHQFL